MNRITTIMHEQDYRELKKFEFIFEIQVMFDLTKEEATERFERYPPSALDEFIKRNPDIWR